MTYLVRTPKIIGWAGLPVDRIGRKKQLQLTSIGNHAATEYAYQVLSGLSGSRANGLFPQPTERGLVKELKTPCEPASENSDGKYGGNAAGEGADGLQRLGRDDRCISLFRQRQR